MWVLIEEVGSIKYIWDYSENLYCEEDENVAFFRTIAENTWQENPMIYHYSWPSNQIMASSSKISSLILGHKQGTIFRLFILVEAQ
jgi:hypothetical protein